MVVSQANLVKEETVSVTIDRDHAQCSVHAVEVKTAKTRSKSPLLLMSLTAKRKTTKADLYL